MDIAYYLSELLEQLGEVNVPGLGSFTRVKVDGYYNSNEGRFYPPASKLEFSQQYIDDDVLTRYIGVKKRISLASSKYFTEKYISNLRMEIMAKEVVFADLGSLYFTDGQLRFRPAGEIADPAFFGYPQISLNKIEKEPAYNWDESIVTESATVPMDESEREPEPEVEEDREAELATQAVQEEEKYDEPATEEQVTADEPVQEELAAAYPEPSTYYQPVQEEPVETNHEPSTYNEPVQEEPAVIEPVEQDIRENQDYFTPQPAAHNQPAEEEEDFLFHSVTYESAVQEEEHHRSYKWLWITALALLITGGGVFAYFYLQPQPANTVKKIKPLPAKDTTGSAISADTAKTMPVAGAAVKNKTTLPPLQNTPASTIDSTKRRYEVIGASVETIKEANKIVGNYKSEGIDAHVVQGAPGPLKKISLGTYTTNAEAMSAIRNLLKTKKVKGIWPLPINPKK